MPWSNQGGGKGGKGGGGPWGSGGGGGGGPWGSGGGGGNQQPPDLEEMLKRSQDRMKQAMHGSGVPGPLLFLAAAVAVGVVAWQAFFFRVNPDEVGVVMRFGEYVRQEPPGLHYRLPYPIEEVEKPKVTQQRILEIGGAQSRRTPGGDGMLMLTGDGNLVDVRSVIYWRIKTEIDKKTGEAGLKQFLFNIQSPENTVREVGESAVREVVGQSNLQSILTEGRVTGQVATQKLMQQILDNYNAGITIDQVQFIEVDPPSDVIAAFRDVQAAGQDKDRMIKEAQTYADQILPKAKGDADRILATAQGFRDQTIAEATGQAARFLKVYEEYKKAPEVTRQRIFLEMQERVLSGADKIIIDGKNGSGVVPFLPLDQLKKKTEGGN